MSAAPSSAVHERALVEARGPQCPGRPYTSSTNARTGSCCLARADGTALSRLAARSTWSLAMSRGRTARGFCRTRAAEQHGAWGNAYMDGERARVRQSTSVCFLEAGGGSCLFCGSRTPCFGGAMTLEGVPANRVVVPKVQIDAAPLLASRPADTAADEARLARKVDRVDPLCAFINLKVPWGHPRPLIRRPRGCSVVGHLGQLLHEETAQSACSSWSNSGWRSTFGSARRATWRPGFTALLPTQVWLGRAFSCLSLSLFPFPCPLARGRVQSSHFVASPSYLPGRFGFICCGYGAALLLLVRLGWLSWPRLSTEGRGARCHLGSQRRVSRGHGSDSVCPRS